MVNFQSPFLCTGIQFAAQCGIPSTARQDAFECIKMFNNPRPKHTTNGMLSPVGLETRQQKPIKTVSGKLSAVHDFREHNSGFTLLEPLATMTKTRTVWPVSGVQNVALDFEIHIPENVPSQGQTIFNLAYRPWSTGTEPTRSSPLPARAFDPTG